MDQEELINAFNKLKQDKEHNEKEYEEDVCDVCGAKADGEYNSTGYLNGDVYFETSCPLDLCKKHMETFAYRYSYLEYERGDDDLENKKSQLLSRLKEDSQN